MSCYGKPFGNGTVNGGNGLNTWSSWASATGTGANNGYYAGGGGGGVDSTLGGVPIVGGTGGLGGGGKGSDSQGGPSPVAGAGLSNTGGGGGGGHDYRIGGTGGSGIVIVRYAI